MPDLGGFAFVTLMTLFAATVVGSAVATVAGLVLDRRGRARAARLAGYWATGFGVAGAVLLLAAGALFAALSR